MLAFHTGGPHSSLGNFAKKNCQPFLYKCMELDELPLKARKLYK